ncbi:MAG: RNB domain-containing ribonuclease [Betaproteobacteria bacterium]|nr:RNB domain-containing ribonuclease [Betaproteobacteria bacterium]
MYALFEEAGKLHSGRVLSEADTSAQIELESGKRVKVKAAHMLLRFEKPAPADLLREAAATATGIELELAWEFAPPDEFSFADLAREYFSDKASLPEQVACLLKLSEAPHYFRRAGKGHFKKAPADIIAQALAAIEKKKALQELMESWAQQLTQGTCPEPIQTQLYKILFKPDKNAPEYKAVVLAAKQSQQAPLTLLQKAGAIRSAYDFHWQRFLFDHFPKGTGFPALQAPALPKDLPLADVAAYSIDDSQTTEIDDALSVQGLGTGTVVLGIHIAAPALALQPGDALDQVARQRLSTVYMPGHKITMLPDSVVQTYTLDEGRACPALSLYVGFNEHTLAIEHTNTRLEQVPIVANLRHDKLDHVVTEQWLTDPQFQHPDPQLDQGLPRAALSFMHTLAKHLKAQREQVRGKPEQFNRPDFNFKLEGVPAHGPTGEESVQLSIRPRGAALDLIVAEAMILANSTWGQWLADLGVPGLYRSQASMAPGVKVRMGTRALPHAGIGVPCYAWSTSPLRRYTDLVNQWQLVACVQHGNTAALVAPFKPKDASLMSIVSAFEDAYSAYNTHQATMERYWTLKYLQQHQLEEMDATVIKAFPGEPPLVRAVHLPLALSVSGAPALERGAWVRVKLGQVDTMALDVKATFVCLLETASPPTDDNTEEETAVGPIAIALDMDDTASDAPATGEAISNHTP